MGFYGDFDHKIDPKGRMNLPAQYRDEFRNGGFISIRPPRTVIYTPEGWAEYEAALRDYDALDADEFDFILGLTTEFMPDAQNRIVLSSKIRERSGLGELVTLVGNGSSLSIWNRDEWIAHQKRLLGDSDGGLSLSDKLRSMPRSSGRSK
ncbi:MAG: hypothetical protein WBF71_00465 [Microthrixaceae bacterium]